MKKRLMKLYTVGLQEIDKTKPKLVGGKGANLGDLAQIEGIAVPEGFCLTTGAYTEVIRQSSLINELLDELGLLKADDRTSIREVSGKIRMAIEQIPIPKEISEEIARQISLYGENDSYAIRSSATAEDLPTASFAGQQDTYLNIVGKESILRLISKCWASLFTERAIVYRIQNGFDHRNVQLAVVVQKMVFPQASGILFTADPMTSNRKVISIDAGYGLGEALVAGLVNADNYKVRNGKLIDKKIASKKGAIGVVDKGGTKQWEIESERQNSQVLTDEQILQLAHLGRQIESHFGYPQDIEWCLADDTFYIVQSRPVTTLYPIPAPPGLAGSQPASGHEKYDGEVQVFISVAHQQMMTDPIKPLGISAWQLTAVRPMHTAGGRLFVNVTNMLASAGSRNTLLQTMGQHDPLMKDALMNIIERDGIIQPEPNDKSKKYSDKSEKVELPSGARATVANDPAVVADLIGRSQSALEALKQNIQTKTGTQLFDFILEDIRQLKQSLFDPQNMGAIMVGINASAWVNKNMKEWLGETNVADKLSQSVPGNITSELGLALLDVADVIRPYPEVIEYLKHVKKDDSPRSDEFSLDDLVRLNGGVESQDAIRAFLRKYGMRCVGEIDITRTRWSEKPSMLIPMLLSHIKNFAPGESKRKFEHGQREAFKKEKELLDRLKGLPNGELKARETQQKIGLIRNFMGYREYPKYNWMNHYFVYKQALEKEAGQLVHANILRTKEDSYYLTFEEFHEAVRSHKLDYQVIDKRKEAYRLYKKLTPPCVITSDGEIITGKYKLENLPANAIAGLAVSSGIIEGRARVILNMEEAGLKEGDILVTRFTDPSWTPLFVSIKGLVTEVGGLMTHGAVIAREYGLPAVVGVENATQMIKDGQWIRVNGTEGYVEIL